MPTREHTDPKALDALWKPLVVVPAVHVGSFVARWFAAVRGAVDRFFFEPPPVIVQAAIPHRAAALCLDCEVLFDTRHRQTCPTCAGESWTLLTGIQRKEKRGRKLTPAAAVVPIRRRG